MKLKFIIEKLEDVEEAYRPLYKKRDDGKFQIDTDAEGVEDVAGLKSALDGERREHLETKKKLEGLSKNELKELAKLKKEREDADRKKLEDEGDFEAIKKQMVDKHNEELAGKDKRIDRLSAQVRKLMIENAATAAIVEAKGNPKLLGPIVNSALKLIETDDDFQVAVVDERGQPRVADAKGTPMSIAQYVESLKTIADYQPAFSATGKTGGGQGPNNQSGNDVSLETKPLKDWSLEEKSKYIADNGMEAWRDLVSKRAAA